MGGASSTTTASLFFPPPRDDDDVVAPPAADADGDDVPPRGAVHQPRLPPFLRVDHWPRPAVRRRPCGRRVPWTGDVQLRLEGDATTTTDGGGSASTTTSTSTKTSAMPSSYSRSAIRTQGKSIFFLWATLMNGQKRQVKMAEIAEIDLRKLLTE